MTGAFFRRLIAEPPNWSRMPHPDVNRLATDPSARVMVFVDGQNLYKRSRELFGHPLCHPHLLAHSLAGPRTRNRVSCRFYTGRPNPNVPGEKEKARNLDRRLAGMRSVGVTVITRPLRYHWTWGHRQRLPKAQPGAAPIAVDLSPWPRPQEKGIDLAVGLDVLEMILTDRCDVAVIVSLDRDLAEIPNAIRNMTSLIGRPVRLEAAVPVPVGQRYPKILQGFDYTHQITEALFNSIRDDTDYTVPPDQWTKPVVPPRPS